MMTAPLPWGDILVAFGILAFVVLLAVGVVTELSRHMEHQQLLDELWVDEAAPLFEHFVTPELDDANFQNGVALVVQTRGLNVE